MIQAIDSTEYFEPGHNNQPAVAHGQRQEQSPEQHGDIEQDNSNSLQNQLENDGARISAPKNEIRAELLNQPQNEIVT